MAFLNPAEYGFSASDPDTYVAIAVMDFIDQSSDEDIHLTGKLSNEYIGMLCSYAIARGLSMLEEYPVNYKLMQVGAENFDPLNISEKLLEFVKKAINGDDGTEDAQNLNSSILS